MFVHVFFSSSSSSYKHSHQTIEKSANSDVNKKEEFHFSAQRLAAFIMARRNARQYSMNSKRPFKQLTKDPLWGIKTNWNHLDILKMVKIGGKEKELNQMWKSLMKIAKNSNHQKLKVNSAYKTLARFIKEQEKRKEKVMKEKQDEDEFEMKDQEEDEDNEEDADDKEEIQTEDKGEVHHCEYCKGGYFEDCFDEYYDEFDNFNQSKKKIETIFNKSDLF